MLASQTTVLEMMCVISMSIMLIDDFQLPEVANCLSGMAYVDGVVTEAKCNAKKV